MRTAPVTFAVCLALIQAAAGCTVIHIQAAGKDDVEVRRLLGIVSIELKPGPGAVLVDSATFGAFSGHDGLAIGYHSASMVAVPPGYCQLVVWVEQREQLAELDRLLSDRTELCAFPSRSGRPGEP